MSDPVAHTPKEDSKSEEFKDGDVFIRSSDRVLFQVHLENIKFVSTAFPSSVSTSDKVIDFQEDSETLEILLYFAYPHKPLPKLYSLSFKTLMKVLEAADKWGMHHAVEIIQLHIQKYASEYPKEILSSAPNQDCSFIIAAVAPYLVSTTSTAGIRSIGVSDKLCVKWGIYRENTLMVLYDIRRDLGSHDVRCDGWQSHVKLYILSYLDESPSPFLNGKGMWDVYADVSRWMKEWGYDATCCRAALEHWRDFTIEKLDGIQFPI